MSQCDAAIGRTLRGATVVLPTASFRRVGPLRRLRSGPLELEDFILDTELLALQICDRVLVREGTAILLIDGAFQFGVLCSERLDVILQRHARSSSQTMAAADGTAGCSAQPVGS
jgi:hypothetical protein